VSYRVGQMRRSLALLGIRVLQTLKTKEESKELPSPRYRSRRLSKLCCQTPMRGAKGLS
jgi:hypothetical protein